MGTGITSLVSQQSEALAVPVSDEAQGDWVAVCQRLREHYGEAVFKSWLKPLAFDGVSNGAVTLSVPTRFMREWIANNYMDTLREFFNAQDKRIHGVDLIVRSSKSAKPIAMPEVPLSAQPAAPAPSFKHKVPKSSSFSFTGDEKAKPASSLDKMSAALDPRFTFDNYVVGKPNELAFAAAKRVADSAQCMSGANPLFLYGGVGLGKTHLMHAIAWHIRHTNPERKVIYLSAEKFMYQFIKALRFNETMTFKEQFRSVDVLMVDDVQFISGKNSTQEEFFHTFNALIDQNKQLVISADRSPSDLEGIEERIRSRLGWGLVADIHTTSFELRYGILQSKVDQLGEGAVPEEVLEFLARRITSNVRELEGALNRVVAHSTLINRPVTIESTQEVLQDLLRSCDKRITVEDIQKRVAEYYNVKVSDMHSSRRSVSVARPRQIAMYISKQLTSKSLPEIGRKFGGKDHTTVMHAVKRVTELMQKDSELQGDVERLQRGMHH